MHRLMHRSSGYALAVVVFLTQTTLAAAHAGDAHPHVEASPWPIAGPIIALLVSGAAFWLANRNDSRQPPHPDAGQSDSGNAGTHGDRPALVQRSRQTSHARRAAPARRHPG